MATIVQALKSSRRYVLIGVAATERTSGQKLTGAYLHESQRLVCVADEQGELHWFDSRDVRVESVDGVSAGDALG